MDYFQGVVTEYLRADRSIFVNTECLIQLDPGDVPAKGKHWYCDAVAINLREKTIYLCEVTYSSTMHSLLTRLKAWNANWFLLCVAMERDCSVDKSWKIRPWIFIPKDREAMLNKKLADFMNSEQSAASMPMPKLTYLEDVVPWKYKSWDRKSSDIEKSV